MNTPGSAEDIRFMQLALALAERGRGSVEPNPLVGALVVRDGEVIGQGWHAEYGGPHAEVEALRGVAFARGSTVYVTLEPCAHFGKTPPCTEALIDARVGRVVYAAADPDPEAAGGAEVLARAGIEVTGGVQADAARDLNARFFHRFGATGSTRPWIELKLALSLDARIADPAGRSRWITGPESRAEVHRLRAGHDAIAVGIGTVVADDPQLTVRGETQPRRPPVRLVFDRSLRLPLDSALVRSSGAAPLWIACRSDASVARQRALERAGALVIRSADLEETLKQIVERGVGSILCEGGGGLAAALLNRDMVDRLTLFFAPILLGPAGRGGFGEVADAALETVIRWRRLRTESFGPDTLISLARP